MLTTKLTALATAAFAVVATAAPAHAADPWFAPHMETTIPNGFGPGPAPMGTASADFDNDGIADVATITDFTNGDLLVVRGNGDGTFGSTSTIAGTAVTQGIDTGDMNGDGNADVVAMSHSTVRVAFGDGTGQFTLGPTYPFVLGAQVHPRVVDFDNDGDLDLVAPTFGAIQTLRNNGAGAFTAGPYSAVVGGSTLSALTPARLNGDAHPDLLVVSGFSGTTFAMLGDGTGKFTVKDRLYAAGFIAEDIGAIDLDDDGFDDTAVIGSASFTLATGLNDGTGKFVKPYPSTVSFPGAGPTSLAVADLNGDGRDDLITSALFSTQPIRVLAGNGTAKMADAGGYSAGRLQQNPVVVDADGDGKPDIVAAGLGSLSFLKNIT